MGIMSFFQLEAEASQVMGNPLDNEFVVKI
jgi:hypothetical protein